MSDISQPMSAAMEAGAKTARHTMDNAKDAAGEAGDAVRRAAHDAKDYGRKAAAQVYDAAGDSAKSIIGYINEKPVQAALIGVGGLLLASMLFRRR
jgi:ElaB/YqjD/DUF883 family membrane-anchored ribosome-binding protein